MDSKARLKLYRQFFLYHSLNQTQIRQQFSPTELLLSPLPPIQAKQFSHIYFRLL